MKKDSNEKPGIQLLLDKYKQMFRIPENLNFYSEEDYQAAEKAFLKYAIFGGSVNME